MKKFGLYSKTVYRTLIESRSDIIIEDTDAADNSLPYPTHTSGITQMRIRNQL
jgi:hypothetical protein